MSTLDTNTKPETIDENSTTELTTSNNTIQYVGKDMVVELTDAGKSM